MDYTKHPGFDGHKGVYIFHDGDTKLLAIVAIHNDDLGTALGGTRMLPYSSFEEALSDVLRLSAGMTRKAILAGLNYGGGKAVIIGNPKEDKTPELLRAFGRRLNLLNGKFLTGEDMNITVADVERMAEETPYVVGRSDAIPGGSGDPSPMTAYGVLLGMMACLKFLYGDDSLKGCTVAIQGVGKVGFRLARLLHQHKANIVFCDSDAHMVERALTEFKGAKNVSTGEIFDVECDIFAPCAVGGILNGETIPRLRCKIVAGSANNQLATPEDGQLLFERGIIYAVDYVINAGGLINVTDELGPGGYDEARAKRATSKIYNRILYILRRAKEESRPPHEITEQMVNRILTLIRELKKTRREFGLV